MRISNDSNQWILCVKNYDDFNIVDKFSITPKFNYVWVPFIKTKLKLSFILKCSFRLNYD